MGLRSTFILSAWTFCAGVGIPLIGVLSSAMAKRLGNPFSAIVVMFAIAFAISLCVALPLYGVSAFGRIKTVPISSYGAGLLMAFYVISATIVIPRMGAGNFVAVILLAQLVTAAAIDQFGLLGMARQPLAAVKIIGFALLVGGILLMQFGTRVVPPSK